MTVLHPATRKEPPLPHPVPAPVQGAPADDDSPERRKQQKIRIVRHMMAASASVVVVAVVYLYAAAGFIELPVAHVFTVLTALLIAAFSVCFASGWNKRFADPSMTFAQVGAVGITMAYLAYTTHSFRALQVPFYVVALLFGAIRLQTRQLLLIGSFLVVTYGVAMMLGASAARDAHAILPVPTNVVLTLHLALMLMVTAWIGGYVNNMRAKLRATNADLQQALGRIEFIANHDELTGLYNRRAIMQIANHEQKRANRSGAGLCVAMVDADHFKRINDRHGHPVGDEVLRVLARTVQESLRATDSIGRYGGEEFIVVLPETSALQGDVPLERLRQKVASAAVSGLPAGERVTVSIGVAAYRAGEDVSDTIQRADEALYRAKQDGRDRVVWHAP